MPSLLSGSSSQDGAIVLLSGGLDSTVALAEVLTRQSVACALTFDYGQRAAKREIQATRAIADHYQLYHRVIALPWLADLLPQALQPSQTGTAQTGNVSNAPASKEPAQKAMSQPNTEHTAGNKPPEATHWQSLSQEALFDVNRVWVPNRNGLFLNIGACFAEAMGGKTLIFGANAEEGADFPDNTPAFRDQLNVVFGFSTLNGVTVETPVGDLNKIQIVELGVKLNVPFHLIWSCYEGTERQCGQCPSCLRVKNAQAQVAQTSGHTAGMAFQ